MNKETIFCGIAYNFHDSSIAIGINDEVKLVLEAERFYRKKKMRCTVNEMEGLIVRGLSIFGKTIEDVDYWAMETLLNPWLDEKDKIPIDPIWKDINFFNEYRRSLIVNHHLSHANSFLYSPFEKATILTCDGGGDCGERVTIYYGEGNKLKKSSLNLSDFITAKPYDLIATYLYGYPRAEGRLMALSAYGEPKGFFISRLEDILQELCTTDYETGDRLLSDIFPGLKGKTFESTDARDLAASLQYLFLQHRINDTKRALESGDSNNLVLSGGSCLNLECNTSVLKEFDVNLYIPSCCDDTGESLGALVYLMNEVNGKRPLVKLPYLGEGVETYQYSRDDIEKAVEALIEDEVLMIHNSKGEIGPRALGNRSFIARPDKVYIKKKLSEKIKQRESYRPVAPIVLENRVGDYFIGPDSSPFMLHRYDVIKDKKKLVIGSVHKDNSVRVQTITRNSNPFMFDLITSFGDRIDEKYLLLNTSLNLKGEPISNNIRNTLKISERLDYPHRVIYNGNVIK